MGQRTSKDHSPLTFGYVDHNQSPLLKDNDAIDTNSEPTVFMPPDHVLNHPELYKLELICQCNSKSNTTLQTHKYNTSTDDSNDNDSINKEEWVVATQQQECRTCRQNKRMSLVRHHLAKDLEYIDETYYAGISHYEFTSTSNHTTSGSGLQQNRPSLSLSLSSSSSNGDTADNNDYYDNDDDDDDDDDDNDNINENWAKITVGEVTSQAARNTSLPGGGDNQGDASSSICVRTQSTSFTLDLSGRSLVKLSSGIGYLSNLTKLNLSNNQLSSLPKSIGYLNNLSVLNTSNNQLDTLPDTMMYLTKLKAINISHNKITYLPPALGSLPELIIIIAHDNQIKWVPKEIANLQQMISFNISNNPLQHLPAELANIKSLRKLVADGCDFETEFVHKREHDPPTLFEQCARTIVRHQLDLPDHTPDHIQKYLSTHQECSYCHGPYFESFVTRGRFIERVARQPIALEYRLCRAHWDDDQDRLLNLFSSASPLVIKNQAYSGPSYNGATGTFDNVSSQGARKRSASTSSAMSSSYRLLPSLPPLPSLESCSGGRHLPSSSTSSSRTSSPAPTPSNSTMRLEQQQQLRPTINRPRANSSNSITKRFAYFLSPSKSNNNNMTRSRSHSSLRQEIITESSTTSPLHQENSVPESFTLSPGEGAASSPVDSAYQVDRQQQEPVPDDSNLIGDHQPLRHRMVGVNRAGVLPSPDMDDPSSSIRGHPDPSARYNNNNSDGSNDDSADKLVEHRFLLSISQPTHLHATTLA
ncbi:hypothetical protein BC941DRAFT_452299 [Chlamydoabsidia padenii]|nr:hypothetical protein BC941DRAFT_452299 [Chlamydoabsidia padenii]